MRPTFPFKRLLMTTLLVLGLASGAQAQRTGDLSTEIGNPIGATQGQAVLNTLNRDVLFDRQGDNSLDRPSAPKTETPDPTQSGDLGAGFIPGPSVFPQKLASTLTGTSVQQKQQAKTLFDQMLQLYDEQVASQDPRLKNNVAGAMVYSTYVSYYILTGIELTEPQQEGLFNSLTRTLLAAPEFTLMDDATRQEMYEALVITASFALGAYSNGAEDFSQAYLAETMADGLMQTIYQHSADALEFTDQGVQVRSGSFM